MDYVFVVYYQESDYEYGDFIRVFLYEDSAIEYIKRETELNPGLGRFLGYEQVVLDTN